MEQYYAVVDTNVLVSALLATLKDKESSPFKNPPFHFGWSNHSDFQ